MTQFERMVTGILYNPGKLENSPWPVIRKACKEFNDSEFWHDKEPLQRLKKCFKSTGENFVLTPPFYCDHGTQLSFGEHFYANTGLTILDEAYVTFGKNVFLGPHVSIYTACHPIDAEIRSLELETSKPVTVGDNVWMGGNVTIVPGVTIGSNTIIGAGSVVTKNIPDNVIAAGNPCKVIRQITAEDKKFWHNLYEKYIQEMNLTDER